VGFPAQIFAFMFLKRTLFANFVTEVRLGLFGTSLPSKRRIYSSSNMPEAISMSSNVPHIIQPYKHLLVLLPSENFKVVDLKPDSYAILFPSHSDRQDHKPGKVWLFFYERIDWKTVWSELGDSAGQDTQAS
jgi:hypothetical protein